MALAFLAAPSGGAVTSTAPSRNVANVQTSAAHPAEDGKFSSMVGAGAGVVAGLAAMTQRRSQQRSGRQTSALLPRPAFESELGVQAPVGFWDPLGLSADGDADVFKRRRAAEIKHGRVSMLACIGYIVPEYFKWPGYVSPSLGLKFTDVPHGLAALSKIPLEGLLQIGLFAGHYEGFFWRQAAGREPGDFEGYGFLGIGKNFIFNFDSPTLDPASRTKKLSVELANGRLAMVAIIGMFYQDGLTGSAWGDWSLYTASPLRAFESELGVQAPVGFWDPLGLSADGDSDIFKRRRAAEIKHGRVSMLACIGFIVPEYFKWPGYVSPSLGLKFTDVPNGLGALSKIPLEGLLQIGLFAGHYEGFFWRQAAGREPGDFEGYGFLGIGKNFIFNFDSPTLDPASRTKKLSAELANGRLAMVAIIGMFYQDGLTGSAWGDWSLYTSSPLR